MFIFHAYAIQLSMWWLNMTSMDFCCFGSGDCGKTSHSLPSEEPPQIRKLKKVAELMVRLAFMAQRKGYLLRQNIRSTQLRKMKAGRCFFRSIGARTQELFQAFSDRPREVSDWQKWWVRKTFPKITKTFRIIVAIRPDGSLGKQNTAQQRDMIR